MYISIVIFLLLYIVTTGEGTNDSTGNTSNIMLCVPVSDNEYKGSHGKGIEGLEKNLEATGTTVMNDTCMEIEHTSNNVRAMKSTCDNSVQESDNKPSQHLLYRSV